MAKKSKKSKDAAANGIAPVASTNEAQNGDKPPISEAPARSKISSARTAGRAKPKPALAEKPKKMAARKKSAATEVTVSDEDIRLRAYLISEWRMRNGIAGDSDRDWLEARRQLQDEIR
jgi:hypothetical protein